LAGIAVLININFGLSRYRSVASKEEMYAHIRYIREATKKNQFGLEFLDKLPTNSYKIYSDMNRNAFPVLIFKRINN
jgi:hypothetical protein